MLQKVSVIPAQAGIQWLFSAVCAFNRTGSEQIVGPMDPGLRRDDKGSGRH